MKNLIISLLILSVISCFHLKLISSDEKRKPKAIVLDNEQEKKVKSNAKNKYKSSLLNIVWDDLSLMGIKLDAFRIDKDSDIKNIQKKWGITKILKSTNHHGGDWICYKDLKQRIIIEFEDHFLGGGLIRYKVSQDDVSKYKDCLSIVLENIETKSGLKIGLNRNKVKKIFSIKPFKDLRRVNSIQEILQHTSENIYFENEQQLIYYLLEDWTDNSWLYFGENGKKKPMPVSTFLKITIIFKHNKVSSFEIFSNTMS